MPETVLDFPYVGSIAPVGTFFRLTCVNDPNPSKLIFIHSVCVVNA